MTTNTKISDLPSANALTGSEAIPIVQANVTVNVSTSKLINQLNYIVNVKNHDSPALGDGTTDDTTAIQSAIDSVSTAGGGEVYLPEGTYLVTGLTIKSKVRLIGQGRYATIIKLKNSSNSDIIKTLNVDSLWDTGSKLGEYGWAIEKLQIDGNRTNNTSGNGLKIYGFSFRLIDVFIRSCAQRGIDSMWAKGSPTDPDILMEAYDENVTVYDCGQDGVYWAGPHDTHHNTLIVAQNSQSSPGTYHGIFVDESANSAGSCTFTYAHVWGVYHAQGARLKSASHFVNSHIEGANTNLYLGVNDCTFLGGMVYGVGAASDGIGDVGIELDNVSGSHINTKIMNCDGGLLKWTGTNEINNIKVSGYNASGSVHVGTPSTTNRLDIQFAGSTNDYTFQINRNALLGPLIKGNAAGIGFCNDNLSVNNDNVGIGTSSPGEKLHILGNNTIRNTIETFGGPATFQGKRGQGNTSSKTNVVDTNEVLRVEGRGYVDGTFYQAGAISVKMDGSPASNSTPGRVVFCSTPVGQNFFTERFALLPSGNIIPLSNNTYSFGSVGNIWSEGYFNSIRLGSGGISKFTSGNSSPEGNLTASVGSFYTRTDGNVDHTLYIKESGSGNTGWSVYSNPTISVKTFGAKGDGTTDDTVAIQTAIDYVENRGGGEVHFPSGTYQISSTLEILSDGVYLVGEGSYATEIKNSANSYVISAIGTSSAPINKSGIRRMTIRGGGKDLTNAHGLYFQWGHNCYIQDLVFFGCRHAMHFSHQWQTSVRDVSVHGAGSDQSYIGMYLDATDLTNIDNAVQAVNVFVQATSGYGFRLVNAQGSKFVNCEAGGSPMIHGWYVGDPASGTVKCQWIHFVNCLGDSTSSAAWLFRQGTASEISQIQISNCWAGNGDSGFYFDGCTNVISNNLLAVGNTKNGVILNNSSYCKISHSSLIDNNEGATAIGDIAIQGGSWNSIIGNICNSNAAGKSLIESAATDNNSITDNMFIRGATIIGANTVVHRNRGFKTDNRGSAQITAAATSVVVNHQLEITPTVDHIRITPRDNMGSATKFWISAADATTFTLNVNTAPGSTITFAWSIDIVR